MSRRVLELASILGGELEVRLGEIAGSCPHHIARTNRPPRRLMRTN